MAITRLRELDDDLPEELEPDAAARPVTARLRTLEFVLGALACWLAALAFRPVFDEFRTVAVPTAAAIAAATGIAVVMAHRHVALRFTVIASALIAALFVSYTMLVGNLSWGVVPGPDSVSGLRLGVRRGFRAMLSDSLPLTNHTLALVFLTLLTWIAAAVAAELTQRTTLPALPAVAPIALFGIAMPVVAPNHPPSAWHTASVIVLVLLIILVRAVPDPKALGTVIGPNVEGLAEFHSRSLLSSRLLLGAPLVAVSALAATVTAAAVTSRAPYDPRDQRELIIQPVRVDDPLAQYQRVVGQSPARPAFQISVSGATPLEVARVALVRMDTYDGVRFSTSDRYEVAGPVLTAPGDVPKSGRDVVLRFSNLALDSPWIPSAGTPTRIDLRGVGFDPQSGDLLAPGQVNGLSYELRARVPIVTAEQLAGAAIDSATSADRYRQLPGGLPPGVGRVALERTPAATTPAASLDGLLGWFRTDFVVDPTSQAGHSAGRLEQFLNVDRAGTAEQFATAFAVMARSLGFPARVVVGYKIVTDGEPRPLEFVKSSSYHVWVEVKFDGIGWVGYDPTPGSTATTPTRGADTAQGTETVSPAEGGEQRTPRQVGPSESTDDDAAAPWWRPFLFGVLVTGGIVAIIAAACFVIISLKAARRRRRQRAASPAARVVGAWDEVLDRLHELHFPLGPSMTPREVALAAQHAYGTAATLPLSFLVPDVGRAVFGRDSPDPAAATRSWDRAREFEQNLFITLNRRQRWRARLSLRPFGLRRDPDE